MLLDDVEGQFDAEGHRLGVVPPWPVSLEDEVDRRRLALRIAEHAQYLPETYREVWTLADVEQMSMEEVAQVLEITVANVKSRLHRARLALRQRLADELLGGGA